MKDKKISEKYTLFLLKEKRNLYSGEVLPYLVVSMLVEMMIEANLEITEKDKVKLNSKKPIRNYNQKLYEIIEELISKSKKDEIPFENIIEKVSYSFKGKDKTVIESLKSEMVKDNYISIEIKKTLFGHKELITINDDKFNKIMTELRKEFLEDGKLEEEYILLGSLLNYTDIIKNMFTKYEKETLKKRLKEIKESDIDEKVRIAKTFIDIAFTPIID